MALMTTFRKGQFLFGFVTLFSYVILIKCVYVAPPPTRYVGLIEKATSCSPRIFNNFTPDQRNAEKWKTTDQKYCFGDPSNQKELFARAFYHDDKSRHHVAILCRIVTQKTHITAGSVFNVGRYRAEFKELARTDTSVVWVMNGARQSHSISAYATFWGSDNKETPIVQCIGYHAGDQDCNYQDGAIENVNKTCPSK